MKKFVIALLALIAILAVILYVKMNGNNPAESSISTPEIPISSFSNVSNSSDFSGSSDYSSEDIEKLILKGKETIRKADNVYYEVSSGCLFDKNYYKGSKLKREGYGLSSSTTSIENAERLTTDITDFDKKITDRFSHATKDKHTISFPIENKNLFQKKLVELVEQLDGYLTNFVYVKDDILDGRNCIVVKAYRYNAKTYEAKPELIDGIYAYWIEKSTGFYVGSTLIKPNDTPSKASSTIKNLSFGTVKDSDLAEPSL